LNSGDHFFSARVLEQNHQEIKNAAIIYFDLQVVEVHKVFIKEYPEVLSFSYFVKDTLPHPATFIAKTAFETTNFYKEDFKILSDWKFFLDSICKYNLTYKKINTTLSTFYIGGMSSNPANRGVKLDEKQQVLQEDYSAYLRDSDDVILYKDIVTTFRKSRIIRLLVKLRLLNQF
jgi:hypothetical protein